MKKNSFSALFYVLLGIALIILSGIAIGQKEQFFMRVFDILGWIIIINGIHEFQEFYNKRERFRLINGLMNLVGGFILIFYPGIPLGLLLLIFSIYIVLNGVVRLITYLIYRQDGVGHRLALFWMSLILIFLGISMILNHFSNSYRVMYYVALYAIVLGCSYIKDGIIMALNPTKKNKLKRRLRINAPMFVSALIPKFMMDTINNKLEVEPKDHFLDPSTTSNIEIFVHVSPDGFGTVGHCDICIDDTVYSYGNYDCDSIKLHETVGDGVLFTTKRDVYIPFCIERDNKTIFAYGLKLNKEQIEAVKNKLDSLLDNTYRWYPRSYYDENDNNDYASNVYMKTHAQFYKFHSGKFKTYFVLGTNCVKLAEEVMGNAGMDIIDINGIITPGSYQSYLEKEYGRTNGIVYSKNVYNAGTIN